MATGGGGFSPPNRHGAFGGWNNINVDSNSNSDEKKRKQVNRKPASRTERKLQHQLNLLAYDMNDNQRPPVVGQELNSTNMTVLQDQSNDRSRPRKRTNSDSKNCRFLTDYHPANDYSKAFDGSKSSANNPLINFESLGSIVNGSPSLNLDLNFLPSPPTNGDHGGNNNFHPDCDSNWLKENYGRVRLPNKEKNALGDHRGQDQSPQHRRRTWSSASSTSETSMAAALNETTSSSVEEDRDAEGVNAGNAAEQMIENMKNMPSAGQIRGRLAQIQDYIHQVETMLKALANDGSVPPYTKSSGKKTRPLKQLLSSLRGQEAHFKAVLQQVLNLEEEAANLASAFSRTADRVNGEANDGSASDEATSVCLANGEDSESDAERGNQIHNHVHSSDSSPHDSSELGQSKDEPNNVTVIREELSRKVSESQKKLVSLKQQQDVLKAMKREAENRLAAVKRHHNAMANAEASDSQSDNNANNTVDDELAGGARKLRDLDELMFDNASNQNEDDDRGHGETLSQLHDKLCQLQAKKQHMDTLLHDLEHVQPMQNSSTGAIAKSISDARALLAESENQDNEKMRRLRQMRERLNDVRELIDNYDHTVKNSNSNSAIAEQAALVNKYEHVANNINAPSETRMNGPKANVRPNDQPKKRSNKDDNLSRAANRLLSTATYDDDEYGAVGGSEDSHLNPQENVFSEFMKIVDKIKESRVTRRSSTNNYDEPIQQSNGPTPRYPITATAATHEGNIAAGRGNPQSFQSSGALAISKFSLKTDKIAEEKRKLDSLQHEIGKLLSDFGSRENDLTSSNNYNRLEDYSKDIPSKESAGGATKKARRSDSNYAFPRTNQQPVDANRPNNLSLDHNQTRAQAVSGPAAYNIPEFPNRLAALTAVARKNIAKNEKFNQTQMEQAGSVNSLRRDQENIRTMTDLRNWFQTYNRGLMHKQSAPEEPKRGKCRVHLYRNQSDDAPQDDDGDLTEYISQSDEDERAEAIASPPMPSKVPNNVVNRNQQQQFLVNWKRNICSASQSNARPAAREQGARFGEETLRTDAEGAAAKNYQATTNPVNVTRAAKRKDDKVLTHNTLSLNNASTSHRLNAQSDSQSDYSNVNNWRGDDRAQSGGTSAFEITPQSTEPEAVYTAPTRVPEGPLNVSYLARHQQHLLRVMGQCFQVVSSLQNGLQRVEQQVGQVVDEQKQQRAYVGQLGQCMENLSTEAHCDNRRQHQSDFLFNPQISDANRSNTFPPFSSADTNEARITLNNQVAPGMRANNYWDNFRSYSQQNLLSPASRNKLEGPGLRRTLPEVKNDQQVTRNNAAISMRDRAAAAGDSATALDGGGGGGEPRRRVSVPSEVIYDSPVNSTEVPSRPFRFSAPHNSNLNSTPVLVRTSAVRNAPLPSLDVMRAALFTEMASFVAQNELRPNNLLELCHFLRMLNVDASRADALAALESFLTRRNSNEGEQSEARAPAASSLRMSSNLHQGCALFNNAAYSDQATSGEESMDIANSLGINMRGGKRGGSMDHQLNSGHYDFLNQSGNTDAQVKLDSDISADARNFSLSPYTRNTNSERDNNLKKDPTLFKPKTDSLTPLQTQTPDSSLTSPNTSRFASSTQDQDVRSSTEYADWEGVLSQAMPYISQHMDEECTPAILTSIRRVVLSAIAHDENLASAFSVSDNYPLREAFVYRQLAHSLDVILASYTGTKLADCGQAMLAELAEAINAELKRLRRRQSATPGSQMDSPAGNFGRQLPSAASDKMEDELKPLISSNDESPPTRCIPLMLSPRETGATDADSQFGLCEDIPANQNQVLNDAINNNGSSSPGGRSLVGCHTNDQEAEDDGAVGGYNRWAGDVNSSHESSFLVNGCGHMSDGNAAAEGQDECLYNEFECDGEFYEDNQASLAEADQQPHPHQNANHHSKRSLVNATDDDEENDDFMHDEFESRNNHVDSANNNVGGAVMGNGCGGGGHGDSGSRDAALGGPKEDGDDAFAGGAEHASFVAERDSNQEVEESGLDCVPIKLRSTTPKNSPRANLNGQLPSTNQRPPSEEISGSVSSMTDEDYTSPVGK